MTPQEEQARHEAKIRQIAEEMAREHRRLCSENYEQSFDEMPPNIQKVAIEARMYAARIAVKHMAEELRLFMEIYTGADDAAVMEYLQSRGLVPAKTGE